MISHTKKRCPKGRKRCKRSMKGSQKGGNPPTEEERQQLLQKAINEEAKRVREQSKRVAEQSKTIQRRGAFRGMTQNQRAAAEAAAAAGPSVAATAGPPLPPIAAAAARPPIFPGSTRHNRRNNKKAIKAKYVFVFDYDHTLTNSYGKKEINVNDKLVSITHSLGKSYSGIGLFTNSEKPSTYLYNSSDMTRGTYSDLVKQLSYFKDNGVLMFVNSRGIQSQLLQRLKADKLLKYFGTNGTNGSDDSINVDEKDLYMSELIGNSQATGDITNGVYGASEGMIGTSSAWEHLKVKVIENILEKLKEKDMINADTEVHFFDDEPDNVKKFNSHFNPQMVKEFNSYEKSANTKYKGHYIGNRGGAGKPSITEKLEIMNIALEYEYNHGVKVNIIDRIDEVYKREQAIIEAKRTKEPIIIIVRNASKGVYAYTLILNLEYTQSIKHFNNIDALHKELFGPEIVGGSRKQRKTKKSTRKSTRKQRKPKKTTKKQRKHKKTTKKH